MKLTIDPGLTGTGWATWSDKWQLLRHGVILPKQKDISERIKEIIYFLKNEHFTRTEEGITKIEIPRKFREVFVEQPEFFQSKGGMVTARSGALIKLTLLVGAIMNEFNAKPVLVRTWKGQLPKEVVMKRIEKILGKKILSHAADAVGIGLHLAGRF